MGVIPNRGVHRALTRNTGDNISSRSVAKHNCCAHYLRRQRTSASHQHPRSTLASHQRPKVLREMGLIPWPVKRSAVHVGGCAMVSATAQHQHASISSWARQAMHADTMRGSDMCTKDTCRFIPSSRGMVCIKCSKPQTPPPETRSSHWSDNERAMGPSFLQRP